VRSTPTMCIVHGPSAARHLAGLTQYRRSSVGSPFRGYRPRVVSWGGSTLGDPLPSRIVRRPGRPAFMQHGMCESYVAVGCRSLPDRPKPRLRYIAPQPMVSRVARGADRHAGSRSRTHRAALEGSMFRGSGTDGARLRRRRVPRRRRDAGWPPDWSEAAERWDAAAPNVRLSGRVCKRRRVRCACCHLGYDVDSAPASTDTCRRVPEWDALMAGA